MAGPYSGIRVVDTTGLSGAYATRLLAGLGAEVIRLESPDGSPLRRLSPFAENIEAPENSLWWSYLAMGTRSVVIDPQDTESLMQLLTTADVVFEDQLPEKSALPSGEISPTTIRTKILPFGSSGPKRHWRTSNLVAWAASGIHYPTGFTNRATVAPAAP